MDGDNYLRGFLSATTVTINGTTCGRFEFGEQYGRADAVDGQAVRRSDAEIRFGRRRRAGRLSSARPQTLVVGHRGGDAVFAPPSDDGTAAATTRIAQEHSYYVRRQFAGKSRRDGLGWTRAAQCRIRGDGAMG